MAEYDGSIKLSVGVTADAKSAKQTMLGLQKEAVSLFKRLSDVESKYERTNKEASSAGLLKTLKRTLKLGSDYVNLRKQLVSTSKAMNDFAKNAASSGDEAAKSVQSSFSIITSAVKQLPKSLNKGDAIRKAYKKISDSVKSTSLYDFASSKRSKPADSKFTELTDWATSHRQQQRQTQQEEYELTHAVKPPELVKDDESGSKSSAISESARTLMALFDKVPSGGIQLFSEDTGSMAANAKTLASAISEYAKFRNISATANVATEYDYSPDQYAKRAAELGGYAGPAEDAGARAAEEARSSAARISASYGTDETGVRNLRSAIIELYGSIGELASEGRTDTTEYDNIIVRLQAHIERIISLANSGALDGMSSSVTNFASLLQNLNLDSLDFGGNSDRLTQFITGLQSAANPIAAMRAELVGLQADIRNNNNGRQILNDEQLARTQNRIVELREQIAQAEAEEQRFQQILADRRGNAELQALNRQYAELTSRIQAMVAANAQYTFNDEGTYQLSDEYNELLATLETVSNRIQEIHAEINQNNGIGGTPVVEQPSGNNQQPLFDMSVTNQELVDVRNGLQELLDLKKQMESQGMGTGYKEYDELISQIDRTSQRYDALNSKQQFLASGSRNIANTVGNAMQQVGSSVSKLHSKIMATFKRIAKIVASVISMFKRLKKQSDVTGNGIQKSFKRALTTFLKFGLGMRGLFALIRRLRSAVTTSFGVMAKAFPEINSQMTQLTSAMNEMKGSLGTAIQPIFSALLPIILKVINAISTALTMVGKFTAALTGQKYIYKATAANEDYASSLDSTSDSAKQAQADVLGFDELNKLSDQSDSGSSDSDDPYSYTQEALDPSDAVSKFAEMVKEAWANSDFTEVGVYLGEKLKEALDTAYTTLLPKVKTFVTNLATDFATLINGFVSVDGLADSIGKTVGEAINIAMTGLDTFLRVTEWYNVGQFIVDTVTSFVNQFEWDTLGQTGADYLLAYINTIWTIFTQFDFENVGEKISTTIDTFFETMGAVDETGLNGWQRLGQSVSSSISGILTTINTTLSDTDWTAVGQAIADFISSIDWGSVVWNLVNLVSSFITALGDAFSTWADASPISASIAALLGVITVSTGALGSLLSVGGTVLKVFGSIGQAATALGISFSSMASIIGTIATKVSGAVVLIAGLALAFTNFFSMLKSGFSWLKEILMVVGIAIAAVGAIILGVPAGIAAIVAAIIAVLATLAVLIKEHWTEISTFFINLWTTISTWFTNVWNSICSFLSTIGTWIYDNVISPIVEYWSNMFDRIYEFAEGCWLIIQAVWIVVSDWFSTNVITPLVNFFTGLWNTISSIFVSIWNTMVSIFSPIINWINQNIITPIKTVFSNVCTYLKTMFTNVWSAIKTVFSAAISVIVTGIKTNINGVLSIVESCINGIINAINWFISGFNTVASWAAGIVGKNYGGVTLFSNVTLPRLAEGAVIPPNNEFMAVLGDQKSGTNIEAPLDTIKQAVADVLGSSFASTVQQAMENAMRNSPINSKVYLDGKQLSDSVTKYQRKSARAMG